ncbi:MAG: ribonuclease HII, partial [Cyanobacteria bacterium J06636_16]
RGCLFGPVVAAAVILAPEAAAQLSKLGVKDSKLLKSQKREALVGPIKAQADTFAIGLASVHEIDRCNILQASLLAMKRAVNRLDYLPSLCLIDGNQKIPGLALPQKTIVKGDQTQIAIAAASILAKVWRDTLIVRLDNRYPGYDLASNKGYGSTRHREAITRLGLSPQHRKSFRIR